MTHVPEGSAGVLAGLDPVLLDAYLAGTCTPRERQSIDQWVSAGPGRRALLNGLRRGVTQAFAYPAFSDTNAARVLAQSPRVHGMARAIASRIRPRVSMRLGNQTLPRRTSARTILRACGLIASVCAVVLGYRYSRPTSDIRPRVQYHTQIGQRANVTLSDGSHVMLAPQTSLVVESGFGGAARTVTLSGEAYFDVRPGPKSPFVVQTGAVVTRVLGTAFTVRHYATETCTRVAVLTGKIVMSRRTSTRMPVAIVAGMSGTMMDSSTAVVTGRDVAPYAGWTTGYLVFRGTPTRDVLAALTRWYGYEFRLTDSALAQSNLTIGLSTESAAEALQILQQTLNVELAFEGHVITVRPRRAGRTTVTNRLDERSVLATPRMEIGR